MNNGRSRKRKIKNTSNGQSRKKKNKINEKSRSSWQTPPDDIIQCILQRLTIWDRIQVRMVCQSWRSVSMRKHIRSYPNEAPWLLMRSLKSPVFSNYDHIVFFSLSDRKTLKLTLPRAIREGWVYGSSKDWLIIVKGAYSTMFLLNPISGALSKLPCLSSVFSGFGALKELKGELDTQVMNDFCNRVALSSSDIFAEQCMVGAIFRDRIVAVCRPGDKRWKKVLEFEQSEDAPKLCDIAFSSGMLYVLVKYSDVDVASRATMFTGNEVEIR
ncbi:uncharacterized protein LOC126796888 [Argentina anserina]|uniref:uncharacterized protein LOC126796888 n=1 Tax=Argentina anserina TaxID=57926 RepID=UPI0021767478|nr:uncharacterized protein LOC126796888 [Potentilla anserina]